MRKLAQIISWIALAGTLLPPVLFFFDRISLPILKHWMLAATIFWFVCTPIWMERNKES